MIYDLAIIGAGASGLFAAINAPTYKTIIFDKNTGAKKLALTGNNKSNLTNCIEKEVFLDNYGQNRDFLRDAFKLFFNKELILFLESIGFSSRCLNKRIILKDKSSRELSRTLVAMAKNKIISFKSYEPIVELKKKEGIFILKTTKKEYRAVVVLIACGGMSYPHTGSDGNCYRLVEKLGHTIINPEPFEVPFCARNTKPLQGLSFKNVKLTLKTEKNKFTEQGDIIFTHFGISGPAVLKLSENSFTKAKLFINFFNEDKRTLTNALTKHNKKITNLIKEFMPERFVNEFIKVNKYTKELSNKEKEYISNILFNFELNVRKCSFNKSFVTKGGISTRQINPKTMESKIVNNLFFCGEILDIQGSIGGFNLQAAFSTAFCATHSIKKII